MACGAALFLPSCSRWNDEVSEFSVQFEEQDCNLVTMSPGTALVLNVRVTNNSGRGVWVDFVYGVKTTADVSVEVGGTTKDGFSIGETRTIKLVSGWFTEREVKALKKQGFKCEVLRMSESLVE